MAFWYCPACRKRSAWLRSSDTWGSGREGVAIAAGGCAGVGAGLATTGAGTGGAWVLGVGVTREGVTGFPVDVALGLGSGELVGEGTVESFTGLATGLSLGELIGAGGVGLSIGLAGGLSTDILRMEGV